MLTTYTNMTSMYMNKAAELAWKVGQSCSINVLGKSLSIDQIWGIFGDFFVLVLNAFGSH